MLAPEEGDPSRRASNEQPSEDVMSIIQETRDDDRLPEEVSPLLDDSTIGQKGGAAAPASAADKAKQQQQLRQAKQAAHGEGPVPCYRRPATRNLVLASLLLAAVAVMVIETSPKVTQQVLGRNVTLPDVHLPPMPKIDWNKLPPILRPGAWGGPESTESLLYDPELYPWARDVPGFLQTLETGKAAVEKVRQGLWDKRAPNSELVYPHVHIFNPEPLRRSMNRALLEQSEFVVGVMGTSVTAGHDNYYNQSFPVVWGRIMEEAFTAANTTLVMRNHAMGWNPIHPSYYCVGEIAGADADITLWEFGMMGGTDGDLEQFIRSSILLPKQPHVLLADTMEGCRDTRNGEIPKRTDPPPEAWVPGSLAKYRDAGFSVGSTRLIHSYMFLDHIPDGGYDLFELYVRDKPTDRPASWHPGPHGHELRADVLAWNYLGVLGEAIDEVHAFVGAGNTTLEEILPQKKEVPPPSLCQPDLCQNAPSCLTTFAPRAGPSLRAALVAPTESDKLPFVEDFGEAGANSRKEWHEQLYSVDVPGVSHMLQLEFNYLDRKYILQGENAGPIDMEFESRTEGYFMVCGPPGHQQHCNATNTKWTIDGEGIGCKFKEQSQKDGTPYVEEPCAISDRKIPAGKHKLELHKHSGEGPLEISHLIWF